MADLALPLRLPGRRLRASALAVPLALALGGCADPQSGGGTELPIQVRIYGGVAAREWRMWSVEGDTSGNGTRFVSRGVLQDSGGILALPSDPGVYLLEAWTVRPPSDSLVVRRSAAAGFVLDTSCIESIPLDLEIHQTRTCPSMDLQQAPSASASAPPPDRVAWVRLSGRTPQRLQLLDDAGARRLLPAELRLWSISADSAEDQTLVFRGILPRESDGTFRFPTLPGTTRWILEGATSADALPETVAARVRIDSGWSRALACQESILPPLPSLLSVHACPPPGWQPSGRDDAHPGADLWSVFTTALP